MKKVLITGGDGDMARAIAERFKYFCAPSKNEMDVTSPEQVARLIGVYKPDILINCAGYIKSDSVKNSDIEEWRKQIEVNLMGVYYCAREAIRNGVLIIINIASSSGFYGRPDWSAYCAAKAGVISLTQSLAEEGINAYCISPHRTATGMRKRLFSDEDNNTLIQPSKIADVVMLIIDGHYKKGDNIEVSYDSIKIRD